MAICKVIYTAEGILRAFRVDNGTVSAESDPNKQTYKANGSVSFTPFSCVSMPFTGIRPLATKQATVAPRSCRDLEFQRKKILRTSLRQSNTGLTDAKCMRDV